MLHLKFKMKSNNEKWNERRKQQKDEHAINRYAIELLCYAAAVFCVCAFVMRLRFSCSFFNWVHFNHFNFSTMILFWMLWRYGYVSCWFPITCVLFFPHPRLRVCLFVCRHQYFKFNKLFKFSISIASVGWILSKWNTSHEMHTWFTFGSNKENKYKNTA